MFCYAQATLTFPDLLNCVQTQLDAGFQVSPVLGEAPSTFYGVINPRIVTSGYSRRRMACPSQPIRSHHATRQATETAVVKEEPCSSGWDAWVGEDREAACSPPALEV